MAKEKGPSKSQLIRELLTQNPKMSASEVVADLRKNGTKVTANLVYYTKGRMRGMKNRKARRQAHGEKVAKVVPVSSDPVAIIVKVKGWAAEVGGLKKLKELVEALSD